MEEFKRISRVIPRQKRADLLVEEIKRWIVAGRLQPGDRLPQEGQLIELLQSSRGTVREALKVLESQGLVEIVRGVEGGARVSRVSYEKASQALRNYLYFQPPTWSQVYQVREQLEPRMAVEVVDTLTADDLAALQRTIDVCELGIAGAIDVRAHRIAELEFHVILARACADPMLRFMCSFINDLLRDLALADPGNIIGPRQTRFACEAVRFHSELIAAYRDKDRERVQSLMADHVHDAGCIVSEREKSFNGLSLLMPNVGPDWDAGPASERRVPMAKQT